MGYTGQQVFRLQYTLTAVAGVAVFSLVSCPPPPPPHTVCFNINAWPRPTPGRILSLPCVGSVLYIRIPTKSDNTSSQRALTEAIPRSPTTIVLPHISQVNYYQ